MVPAETQRKHGGSNPDGDDILLWPRQHCMYYIDHP